MADNDGERFEKVDLEAWRVQVREALKGRDPDTLRWRSVDGVELEPLYVDAGVERGVPGAPPFVRGSEPATAEGRDWLLTHELQRASVDEARRALEEGADAVWISSRASSTLTRPAELAPFAALGAPVFLEGGAHATALSAAWLAEPPSGLTVLSDPLSTLAAHGALPTSLERAFTHLAEIVGRAAERQPDARPVLVSSRPYHEGGARAVDELALLVASGVAYLRGLVEAGHPLADLPRRMLFELALDADFFVGIAKLRAARLLWSKVLRALGVDGPEQGMRVRARASGRMASALEPELDILRGTAAGFAGVVGGAALVTVAPYDALSPSPGPHAARLARTTQLVMRHEAHLGRVLDPAGGSYFLEALTDDLARRAWAAMQEIEHFGGVARGLVDGAVAERVLEGAEARRRAVATGAQGVVAVNRYPSSEAPTQLTEPPASTEAPGDGASDSLGEGPVLDRLTARGASFAALTAALSEAGARAVSIPPMRDAAPFEALRGRAADLPSERRRAWVIGVGDPAALRARMEFARESLAIGGLAVEVHPARASVAEAMADLGELSGVVAACASDDDYPALASDVVSALRDRGARGVVFATRPTEGLHADAFVHRGADFVQVLGAILDLLEAT